MASTPGGSDSLTRVMRAGVLEIHFYIPEDFYIVVPRLYLRWVWEHSFTEADFTDWADGFPTAEDNVADCAVMSHDQVGQMDRNETCSFSLFP